MDEFKDNEDLKDESSSNLSNNPSSNDSPSDPSSSTRDNQSSDNTEGNNEDKEGKKSEKRNYNENLKPFNGDLNEDNDKNDKRFEEFNKPNMYRNKEIGTDLFYKGDLEGAIKFWSKSIKSLSYILNNYSNNDDKEKEEGGLTQEKLDNFVELYVSLCLNISLAHLKRKEYEECKKFCQCALMYNGTSLKAHLRIVQAEIFLKNFENALSNCEKGLKFHPKDLELLQLKREANKLLNEHKNKQKEFCKNIFTKLDHDPRIDEYKYSFLSNYFNLLFNAFKFLLNYVKLFFNNLKLRYKSLFNPY